MKAVEFPVCHVICRATFLHHRWSFGGPFECIGSRHVGICLDTANSIGCLENLETVLEALGHWTVNLHVKDFQVLRPSHRQGFVVEGCPAGQGQLDIPWLSGKEGRRDILVKDRYRNFWVFNNELKLLWKGEGQTGHFPYPFDVDGDGRDEVLIGYSLWDHTGRQVWSRDAELKDHADGIAMGNLLL